MTAPSPRPKRRWLWVAFIAFFGAATHGIALWDNHVEGRTHAWLLEASRQPIILTYHTLCMVRGLEDTELGKRVFGRRIFTVTVFNDCSQHVHESTPYDVNAEADAGHSETAHRTAAAPADCTVPLGASAELPQLSEWLDPSLKRPFRLWRNRESPAARFVARFSLKASPAVIARGCFGMLRYDATSVLQAISIPVLVVTGDRDPVTQPDSSERISNDVPSARLQRLEPAKHYGMIEHVAAFAGSTSAFCNES